MQLLKEIIMNFLSFKTYVILPVIIFVFAMLFRIKFSTALKSAFTIGIGFLGLFIMIDYFVKIINPVVQALIARTGLHFNVLDVGWPPLAAITWSFSLAPLLILIFMIINVLMLFFKLTKTVDIDIWNYWHFIFTASLVYNISQNIFLAIAAAIVACVVTIKLADWSAPMVHKFSGMEGISIPTLSAVAYFPIAVLGDKIIDKLPFLNKIDANPEKMQSKLGLAGEPMIIGFVMGALLGIGAGYDIKSISEISFGVAAVIYILPRMSGIVGTSLIPISEGMKEFIKKHFPNIGETYIALDVAVLVGAPSVVVTAIILMPISLILAFILPGVTFIPLGDLTNLMGTMALVCVAVRGNIIRSVLIGIPIVIGNLYAASGLAYVYTSIAHKINYQMSDYNGAFTAFLDGGNLFRTWVVKLFTGNMYAAALIPVILWLLYFTWREVVKVKNI